MNPAAKMSSYLLQCGSMLRHSGITTQGEAGYAVVYTVTVSQ